MDTTKRKMRVILQDVTSIFCESAFSRARKTKKKKTKTQEEKTKPWLNELQLAPLEPIDIVQNFEESCSLQMHTVPDIDCDARDNPEVCSIYAADIHASLKLAELVRRPNPKYMQELQPYITPHMRGLLIDWLVEISEEHALASDTLYFTTYLLDFYLSQSVVEPDKLQLLGITCMHIASKFEEQSAPPLEELCYITDNSCTREEVLQMEVIVWKSCGYQVFYPTAKTFLRRFLRVAQASYGMASYELVYLANYFAELALVDYGFLKIIPSAIAASAIFLARWTLDQTCHPWNQILVHYTSYDTHCLKEAVLDLQKLFFNAESSSLDAVRIKYSHLKYKAVSTLSYSKNIAVLF